MKPFLSSLLTSDAKQRIQDKIQGLMQQTDNIRNVAVIGNEFGDKFAGERSTKTVLSFLLGRISTETQTGTGGGDALINIINIPENCELEAEVINSLRITDGVLISVDVIDGITVNTERVLQKALANRVKPILCLNNLDRLFELGLQQENFYEILHRRIETFNVQIASNQTGNFAPNWTASPENGSVVFASSSDGWAFTVPSFATRYTTKFKADKSKVAKVLWGNFKYLPAEDKMIKPPSGWKGEGWTFNTLVLDPISRIYALAGNGTPETIEAITKEFEVNLTPEEKALTGKSLVKAIMMKFSPVNDNIIEAVTIHLPSPRAAQKYRAEILYAGPTDDEAYTAISECNLDASLMVYILKGFLVNDQYYAFGRVFGKKDLFENKIVQTFIVNGGNPEKASSVPAGNFVALTGVDEFLPKTGTITTSESAHGLKTAALSITPVIKAVLSSKDHSDVQKLREGLAKLSKVDHSVKVDVNEESQFTIACTSESHLETLLNELREEYTIASVATSEPTIIYRETVAQTLERAAMAKSPQYQNRLFMKIEPLDAEFARIIGSLDSGNDVTTKIQTLARDYGLNDEFIKKILAFSSSGTSILVNETKGCIGFDAVKRDLIASFEQGTSQGPLCGDSVCSVKFIITDLVLNADDTKRGADQIIPTMLNLMYGAFLKSEPQLMEPIYSFEIQAPKEYAGAVQAVIQQKRGIIEEFRDVEESQTMILMQGSLPVAGSFGINKALMDATKGRASLQMSYSHYDVLPNSNPYTENDAMTRINNIRASKS
ncbi:hypothetical protein ABW20_dc0110450 [Dactylellina cionopaga]|nr:hypothetical protein ABW20_dc0110450 [Dactylellina cionopaga]